MSAQSNNNGRAYEYACLTTLCNSIGKVRKAQIIDNSSLHAAKRAWDTLQPGVQSLYRLSAESIVATVFALEPRILENCGDVLNLYIQTDDNNEVLIKLPSDVDLGFGRVVTPVVEPDSTTVAPVNPNPSPVNSCEI